jgi:hypothetical protein
MEEKAERAHYLAEAAAEEMAAENAYNAEVYAMDRLDWA